MYFIGYIIKSKLENFSDYEQVNGW